WLVTKNMAMHRPRSKRRCCWTRTTFGHFRTLARHVRALATERMLYGRTVRQSKSNRVLARRGWPLRGSWNKADKRTKRTMQFARHWPIAFIVPATLLPLRAFARTMGV